MHLDSGSSGWIGASARSTWKGHRRVWPMVPQRDWPGSYCQERLANAMNRKAQTVYFAPRPLNRLHCWLGKLPNNGDELRGIRGGQLFSTSYDAVLV